MDKIRVGIIGLGKISTLHMNAYKDKKLENAEIIAICDKDKKKLRPLAKSTMFQKSIRIMKNFYMIMRLML